MDVTTLGPLVAGDKAWIQVEIVTALATGYRVKAAGMTEALVTYFCVKREQVHPINPAAPTAPPKDLGPVVKPDEPDHHP